MFSFCFEINLQTLRSERINVAAGHRSIDFKTKSCKKNQCTPYRNVCYCMCAQELLGPELVQLPCNHGNEAMDGPGQET